MVLLPASISTVEVRAARVRGAVFEIKSLCEDFRMQICGGIVGAVQLFESGIVPKLLANAGTWVGITATTIKKLDAIQNLFVHVVLRLPSSTVLPSYRAETAMVGFKWRVYLEKLRLMEAIKRQEDEVLAKEVLEQQLLMGWPGLAQWWRRSAGRSACPTSATKRWTRRRWRRPCSSIITKH